MFIYSKGNVRKNVWLYKRTYLTIVSGYRFVSIFVVCALYYVVYVDDDALDFVPMVIVPQNASELRFRHIPRFHFDVDVVVAVDELSWKWQR